jgi:hypothetical protein
VCRADQPLACVCRLLATASEQQSGAGLAHARFHTLIRRILPAALQGDFHASGIVLLNEATEGREDVFAAQFSGLYVKRKNKIPLSIEMAGDFSDQRRDEKAQVRQLPLVPPV